MKPLLCLLCLFLLAAAAFYWLSPKSLQPISPITVPHITNPAPTGNAGLVRLKKYIDASAKVCRQKGFSTAYRFFIDMSLPAGKNRFFVYDAIHDSIIQSGLVAHGSCNTRYAETPQFSNIPGCGCSSLGKYKIGYAYAGQFGKAFKLYGLDSSNSNAFVRNVVLHSYDGVPDKEVYPNPVCNSLGCPMVSQKFLNTVASIIENSKKPILLWIYN